ncbi:hypothetical protein BGX34_011252 [Mortierella sp. NVP85]|nr:hypothetical protein BGX34_011252 [Mortierella sp. NVP85]
MSCSAAQPLPASTEHPVGPDARRPRRQRISGRGGKPLMRDNIENAPSVAPSTRILAPQINQEQSAKIRKRQSSSDCGSKKRKVLQDTPALAPQSTPLNITPLHRTLSDQSAYLNRASLHDVNGGQKESPSKSLPASSCNGASQSKRSECESEDADDEDEASALNAVRSASKIQAPHPSNDAPYMQIPVSHSGLDITNADAPKNPPIVSVSLASYEDDLFGSDTTLTSPEDDSDDEQNYGPSPAQPSEASPIPVLQVTSTQPVVPTRRGRPRKNPSSDAATNRSTRKRPRKNFNTAALAKEPPAVVPTHRAALSVTTSIASERSTAGTRMSLMARIIDGKKLSQLSIDDDDSDTSGSSDDVELKFTATAVNLFCQHDSTITQEQSGIHSVQAPTFTLDSQQGTDRPSIATSSSAEHMPTSVPSKLALPPANAKDHVFAIPTVSANRTVRSSARIRPYSDRRPICHRPSNRQSQPRPVLRYMPRPRFHQTCLDIVTQSLAVHDQSNIHRMASMLRHRLQWAAQWPQKNLMESESLANTTAQSQGQGQSPESLQMQAWSAVIGNGKGLVNNWTRKQEDQQQRVTERRAIVANAYHALNLPPPSENWDKSSKVIDAGYALKSGPATNACTIAERWITVRDDALDHLSRRVGCEYCRKTFQNRNGLIAHAGRCTMAQLQTSMSHDFDGDSTCSETEDQRKARCPKASCEKNSVSQDEYDDEDAIIMCLCGSKEDEGAMIQCDKCKVWLHMECVDLTDEDIPEEYFCPMCLGLPTPSTAGKSFRPVSTTASKQNGGRRRSGPSRHSRSEESASDSEDLDTHLIEHSTRRSRGVSNKIVLHYESGSGIDEDDSGTDLEDSALMDEIEEGGEGLGSPQVILNHTSEGFEDGEYLEDDENLTAVCGVKLTRPALKQSRGGLMLDGSSQESQPEMGNTLLSGELGYEDNSLLVFQQLEAMNLSPMKMEPDSGADLSFHRSQSMDFLVSAETLFEPGYKSFEEYNSDHLLLSESTLDSDGPQLIYNTRATCGSSMIWIVLLKKLKDS